MSTTSFPDSFDPLTGDSQSPPVVGETIGPLSETDGFSGNHDSLQDDSFSNFIDHSDTAGLSSSFVYSEEGVFVSEDSTDMPIRGESGGFENGMESEGLFVSDGPILPPPSEMQEEGSALKEWRRKNAIVLEEKEKKEKEVLSQIIEEANQYKVASCEKRKTTCESNKTSNREKEKVFLASQEKFHNEADTYYWKSIAELIPNEVPALKKRTGKKEQENKPSIVVVQGPKPGKPADLSRMRQILVKLKHSTPDHLKLALASTEPAKDDKTSSASTSAENAIYVAANKEAVVAA